MLLRPKPTSYKPGVAVLVVQRGKVIYRAGHGFADIAWGQIIKRLNIKFLNVGKT